MTEIIPAIIPKTAEDLKEKLELVKGLADTVHIDFIKSSPSPLLYKGGGMQGGWIFFAEAHLMLPDPRSYIDNLVRAGFSRVIIQVEALSPESFAELLHEWRGSAEIVPSFEIETPLSVIDSFAHELTSVQLMGIAKIGAQGKPFDTRVIERVRALHTKYPHLTIAVDGGVNKENAVQLAAAGATRLVVGSAINEFYG